MKLAILFGSGVSFPTGLMRAGEVTKELLSGEWHDHTDGSYYKGKHPSSFLKSRNKVPHLQRFLGHLSSIANGYLADRNRTESNYEDLYYLSNQVNDDLKWEFDNPAIQPFVEQLENEIVELKYPDLNNSRFSTQLTAYTNAALDFIQCVVWECLSTQNEIVGFQLLLQLLEVPEIENVSIGTLNHDLLVERMLTDKGIRYLDGFGDPDGDVRFFDETIFLAQRHKVHYYKLHGSLNWFRVRDGRAPGAIFDRYALLLNPDVWHNRDSRGTFVDNLSGIPLFLTGSYNKMIQYNYGIIKHMLHHYEVDLHSCDKLIVSGYGWNDKGINGRLFEWLDRSTDNQLILLHRDPEHSIKTESRSAMWHRYEPLVVSGQIVSINKWFSETDIKDVLPILMGS